MRKVALIARREFLAAVANRGFIIGLVMMPALFGVFAVVAPRLFAPSTDPIRGQIVLVDPSGRVEGEVRRVFDPATMESKRQENARLALLRTPAPAVRFAGADQIAQGAMGPQTHVEILARPSNADPEREKDWLLSGTPTDRHLAVVAIHPNAVAPEPGGESFGTYDLYVSSGTTGQIENIIHTGVRDAIVSARARAQNLERSQVEAMMAVRRPTSVTVTRDEARKTVAGFNIVLPMVFAGLLVFGVMIGGQTLLTNTIEEKSSRVIEVLLSAVSPLELMAGKILGQLGVSLLVLFVYSGIGLLLLASFALAGLLDPWLVVYLFVFFLITYGLFASVFAAAGAAVNDLKEAQTLMGPIMLLLMGPWLFAFPIARDPNSTFALALSFVPPLNSFVMMIRLSSSTPPPTWQALLSVAIGLVATGAAVWFASKVFKIGLLMHGKPPNFRTLIRWARAA